MIVIEMNPRVSRSSALASKATGFPIAKIAAKLAVGYRLDEIRNDITRETPACFEPTIDYVVTKIPRWAFEKFPEADPVLTTQMKSVGEVMAIGRTFKESLQKALRGLEVGRFGLGCDKKDLWGTAAPAERGGDQDQAGHSQRRARLVDPLRAAGGPLRRADPRADGDRPVVPGQHRRAGRARGAAPRRSASLDEAGDALLARGQAERLLRPAARHALEHDRSRGPPRPPAAGYPARLQAGGYLRRRVRGGHALLLFDLRDARTRRGSATKPRVVILGGGPNRIGQGIEFDYCCCQAAFALRADGYEVVMVNSNPETVSTDYDTSDRLFFEPLTVEDVLNICERVEPMGVIVQFGGQTPLNLARALEAAGVPIIGTSPESIDLAEDRERFRLVIERLGLKQPPNASATRYDEARRIAERIGYPVVVRPSFVLGGRAMEIVYDEPSLDRYMAEAVEASPEHPILIDKFLEDAIEVDVDAVCDGERTIVGGVMEHIEEAGIHSGDSACAIPPFSLSAEDRRPSSSSRPMPWPRR